MAAYANQKTVKINKTPCNFVVLDNGTFKLWLHLASNQNGYQFDLSPVHTGIAYQRAYHQGVFMVTFMNSMKYLRIKRKNQFNSIRKIPLKKRCESL